MPKQQAFFAISLLCPLARRSKSFNVAGKMSTYFRSSGETSSEKSIYLVPTRFCFCAISQRRRLMVRRGLFPGQTIDSNVVRQNFFIPLFYFRSKKRRIDFLWQSQQWLQSIVWINYWNPFCILKKREFEENRLMLSSNFVSPSCEECIAM